MDTKNRRPLVWLVIALVIIFLGSFLAQTYHTSFGTVKAERISFDTDKGTLSGILYLPAGAGPNDARPSVVVTHGYLNSAEMQDANAIELSRRGYVVLALDMYDHGHSAANADVTGTFFSFWPSAMYDAVEYLYPQPYVLKDAQGNGIIGVTGHSMGGFSSTMAVQLDEEAFATTGIRKISASLTEGSDFLYTGMLANFTPYTSVTVEVAVQNAGGRTLGKLAAQFDEFFYNADDNTGGTVKKKNFVATSAGKAFLEQADPKPDTWYDTADGGRRIVYQPYEIHPWNHFSLVSTGHAIDFYTAAFAPYSANLPQLAAGNQIWLYKELFELLALIGFVLLFVPLIMLLQKLPFLKLARAEALAPSLSVSTARKKTCGLLLLIFAILVPALIFPSLMDKKLDGIFMQVFKWGSLAFAALGLVLSVLGLLKKQAGKSTMWSGLLILLASGSIWYLTAYPTFVDSRAWPAPTVNQIVYWALISGLLALLIMALVFLLWRKKEGGSIADYGIKAKPVTVAASLVTAICAVLIGYGLVFLIDALFLTDMRIWVFAFKTFEPSILLAALRYLPFLFVYFFLSAVAICVNTNTQKMQGIKGYLLAIALNCGGIVLYLIAHYGLLFLTGTAMFPNQSLSSILLFGFVPTLAIAAIFTRALYKRNGNIWVAAFLNALLLTLMTLANTAVYFQR